MNTAVMTVVLIVVAGLTVPLWLWLVTLIPGSIVKAITPSYYAAMIIMQPVVMLLAAATVFSVGFLALSLPWYAALIAGVVIGLTTYAQPDARELQSS
jgi:hypothetical protein